MNVCIIPARGGSKRIPRKNIKSFHGKPIISYSIDAAKAADCFDKIIVSTDDKEIAEVALSCGAEVPFTRPAKVSDDHATTMDVIQHAIGWFENNSWEVENICCIYATAPFIRAEDIASGLNKLDKSGVEYSFSATTYPFPIQRAFYLDKQLRVNMFQPEHLNTRSQDVVEAYHDAGQFYWGSAQAFKQGLPFFSLHSKPVLLPRKRVQDIDTQEDWELAELLYSAMEK